MTLCAQELHLERFAWMIDEEVCQPPWLVDQVPCPSPHHGYFLHVLEVRAATSRSKGFGHFYQGSRTSSIK